MEVEQNAVIAAYLQRLVEDTGASHAMLLDGEGQMIAAQGGEQRHDEAALAALLASIMASSQAVNRLLKAEGVRVLFQQGSEANILAEQVGASWLLIVMSSKRTHVGLLKSLLRQVVDELSVLLTAAGRPLPANYRATRELPPSFRQTGELVGS